MWLTKIALSLAIAAVVLAADVRAFGAPAPAGEATGGSPAFLWVNSDAAPSGGANGPRFRVLRSGPADGGMMIPRVAALPDAVPQLPPVWIGVRCTPLPASLAAHIGNKGLMISNIIAESPADQAGLRQYDVIVTLNGQAIESQEDLIDAVARLGAGNAGALEIIRGGQAETLTIRPVDRSAAPTDVRFKYDEPDVVMMREMKLRGRALRPDGSGNWILEDLGDFQKLPDAFRKLEPLWDQWSRFFSPGGDPADDPDVTFDLFGDDSAGSNPQAQVEVRINVVRDGEAIDIHRARDGSFTVTRTDEQGVSTTAAYKDAEELRAADEAAYQAYRRHAGGRGGNVFLFRPDGDDLLQTRQDLRARLEEVARKAREHAAQFRDQARDLARDMQDEFREIWKYRVNRDGGGAAHEAYGIRQDSSGRVKVTISTGGATETLDFSSVAALRQQRPDIYEKVKGLLD